MWIKFRDLSALKVLEVNPGQRDLGERVNEHTHGARVATMARAIGTVVRQLIQVLFLVGRRVAAVAWPSRAIGS